MPSSAWAHLVNNGELPVSGNFSLSPSEYIRFCQQFYREIL